jgi:hypothetical protein
MCSGRDKNLELVSIEASLDCISEPLVRDVQTEAWRLDDWCFELVAIFRLPQPHNSVVTILVPALQIFEFPLAHVGKLSKAEVIMSD